MDRLERYRQKRDFTRTAEPSGAGKAKARKGKLSYLIQKHDASREHYDFRLEYNGVLMSWACPKGPSLDPADKRLAVHVEDHPLDYGTFEGTIPKGEYGGGTVMMWDRGTWEPHGDLEAGMKSGKFAFDLFGERLHGKWALVRLRARGPQDRGKDNWLLIKEKDDEVRVGKKPITQAETTSVATGRTMEEIARGSDVWHAKGGMAETAAKKKRKASAGGAAKKKYEDKSKEAGDREKARPTKSGPQVAKSGRVKIPAFVSPQLATLVDEAPADAEWLHEIKYDGYRALASIGGGNVVIRTRNGLDWTDKFAPLVEPLAALPCGSALIDGEIAVADAAGHTDFGALQVALKSGTGGFSYYIFDLLHLDGEDLRKLPLRARKDKLAALLKSGSKNSKNTPLIFSDDVPGSGDKVFQHACDLRLEGIISKRATDPYRSGRTNSWLKTKCGMEQEFVIIGWRTSKKGRSFSSILLAVREEGQLRYCGRVGAGYTEARLEDLGRKFKAHARKNPPVPDVPRAILRDAHFVEPVLVAEVAFRGWTKEGMVRQGSFKGLRGDKPPEEVVRENPMPVEKAASTTMAAPKRSGAKKTAKRAKPAARSVSPRTADEDTDSIAGVHITHPDRVLFADHAVTKRELADYYMAVAERMLPHVLKRPLSLLRCPRGSEKECFFQKHANPGWPDQLHKIRITEKSGAADYLYVEDMAGVVAAVQMGVLELHIWGCHVDGVEKPDRMVFDFDPDEGLDFSHVRDAAIDMRKRLSGLGLESFPMVTGGKGVHVVVPLRRGHSWDEHRNFSEALARFMAEEEPERFVANMSKKKRVGKIFVDYLRNQRGATAIAPFSTRARQGAHVSWPVSWEQLGKLKDAHPASVWDGVKKLPQADPWKDYNKVKQALPLKKLLG